MCSVVEMVDKFINICINVNCSVSLQSSVSNWSTASPFFSLACILEFTGTKSLYITKHFCHLVSLNSYLFVVSEN